MTKARRRTLLWGLFSIALAIRLVCCHATVGLGVPMAFHHVEYMRVAQGLLETGVFACTWETDQEHPAPSALMPPLYVGIVTLVYMLFGIKTFAATLILQVLNALALSLIVPVVFGFVQRTWNEPAAWIAALLVTINPALFAFTHLVWETSLFTFGVAVTLWMAAILGERRHHGITWLAFGAWLGVLALLNPALTIAYPLIVLWPVVRLQGWKLVPTLRAAGLTVAGWALTVAPWSARYYYHYGELMYVRSGFMLELWLGVCPEADEHPDLLYNTRFPLLNEEAKRHAVALGERGYVEECGRLALSAIREDPMRYLRLNSLRFLDFWLGTVYTHAAKADGGWPRSPDRAVGAAFLIAELAAFFVLLAIGAGVDTHCRWLLGIIVAYSLTYIATHVMIRYRTPVEPIVAIVLGVMAGNVSLRWIRRPDSEG